MLRFLAYTSFFFSFLFITSCDQQNLKSDKKVNRTNYYNRLNNNIDIIKDKDTDKITYTDSSPDTSLLYKSKISHNVGELVNHSISEIDLLTTKIPQEIINFNITNQNEIYNHQKNITTFDVTFDNDIFNNTDYYYTNGVKIDLVATIAMQSPLSKLLIGLPESNINLYGFSINQNIYTPVNPDIVEVSIGDRPFSAFLTIGQFRESYNVKKNLSIKSSVNFGVLGPASMGGLVQSSIHNIEPLGWENQIKNTFVFDYSVKLQKGIISTPKVELNITAGGNIGTIFNKINTGLYFRTGSFIPVLKGIKTNNNAFQYWFFVTGETNLVFYDATLQGGLFKKNNNIYTIQKSDLNRFVIKLSVGLAVYYKKIGVELQNFYLSPEFKNAYDFRWGRIKLVFQL